MNAPVPEPSLTALIRMLAEQALLAMGTPHPLLKEQPPADPAAARFLVDLLAVLKDRTEGNRTEGNRTEGETRELEAVLYQLRMQVVGLEQGVPGPKGA